MPSTRALRTRPSLRGLQFSISANRDLAVPPRHSMGRSPQRLYRQQKDQGQLRESARQHVQRVRRQEKLEREALQKQIDDEAFTHAFYLIDRDRSGTVEAGEVLKVVRALGREVNTNIFWRTFNVVGLRDDGCLSLQRFKIVLQHITADLRKKYGTMGPFGFINLPADKRSFALPRDLETEGNGTLGHDSSHTQGSCPHTVDNTSIGQQPICLEASNTETPVPSMAQDESAAGNERIDAGNSPHERNTESLKPATPPGSQWLQEAIRQHSALVDVYRSLNMMRIKKNKIKIDVTKTDGRFRRSNRAGILRTRSIQHDAVTHNQKTRPPVLDDTMLDVTATQALVAFSELFHVTGLYATEDAAAAILSSDGT